MTNASATPRTDEAEHTAYYIDSTMRRNEYKAVNASFARQLERELSAAEQRAAEAERDARRLHKALEEVLTTMPAQFLGKLTLDKEGIRPGEETIEWPRFQHACMDAYAALASGGKTE